MKANKSSDTTLGILIRLEREKHNLTQAKLGKLVGLGGSRISKIEHGAPITPEVADYILSKMGSELQLRVVNKKTDAATASFIASVLYHFSKIKGIPLSRAFQYLKIFKGLDYLSQFMDIERTLSYEEITANLSLVCAKNGGAL